MEKSYNQIFFSAGHYDDIARINRMKIFFAMKALKDEVDCGKEYENGKIGEVYLFYCDLENELPAEKIAQKLKEEE